MKCKAVKAFILICFCLSGLAAAKSPLIEKRQKQLQEVHSRLRQTQKRLHEANVREHDLSHQLHESQLNLHEATDRLNHYSVQLRQTSLNLEFTQRRLRGAEAEFEEQKLLIAHRMGGIYKNGKAPLIEFLFGAKNYSSLLDRTYYLGLIINEDIALARAIKKQKEDISVQKELLNHQVERLHAVQQQVKSQYKVYASLTNKRENLLGEVRQQRQAYTRHIVDLEEISAALEKELQELIRREQAKNKTANFTGHVGAFLWPLSTHLITSSFGWRFHPIFGGTRFHTGVDIGAGRGSPIQSAGDGVIIYSGWYGGYGQAVVIDHGNGLSTVYAHCSALYVRQGQLVRKGEVIAAVGSTGNANGPHLHFEVRENGTAVDPMGKF